MSSVNTPIRLRPGLRSRQFMRPETYPSAGAQSYMVEEANHALWVRSKQVGRWRSPIQSVPSANSGVGSAPAVEIPRWRFVYHAGTHATKLYAVMEVMRAGPDNAGADLADDPIAKLLVELADGTDVGTVEFHPSAAPFIDPDDIQTPNLWLTATLPLKDSSGDIVVLTPDTDYYCSFTDFATRLISATVYETSLAADTDNGYLPDGPVAGSPIFDEDRGDMIVALRNAWKRNASPLWHWASSTDAAAVTRTSATRANLFDQSLTTVTASSPGVTLQLANKGTVRRAGVPAKLFVYGKVVAGGPAHVSVRDSGGTDYCEVEIGDPTAQWWESNVELLPNAETKLDLYIESDGTNLATVYACSLLQYET